jgi:23S rRNA (uracil1939-C5)-methyltransferase
VTLRLGEFDRHGTTRARYGGRWIEVEHGIPGETVEAEIIGGKRHRARIVTVLEPAADRVEPPCPYFRDWACGGCQWQQIAYEGQVERKRQAVDGIMRDADLALSVTAVHTLAEPWRYRSTAGIALGKRAGFRRHGSLAIVPIHDCPISHPLIGRLMAELNERLDSGEVPDFHGRVRLDVRLADMPSGQALHVLIRPTEEEKQPPVEDLRRLASALEAREEVAGVSVLESDGSISVLSGSLFATTTVAGRPLSLAAASFFQTNVRLLPDLIERLRDEAEPLEGKRVADIYGGVGVFGLFLAGSASEVDVVESDPLAIEAGRLTAEHWGLSNVRFRPERAENAMTDMSGYDVVILDPPRAGLDSSVTDALLEAKPPLILYVSCLAQSLARDLGPLTRSGYEVEHLELFDFYPQTYHVELLAVLRLTRRSPAICRGL